MLFIPFSIKTYFFIGDLTILFVIENDKNTNKNKTKII